MKRIQFAGLACLLAIVSVNAQNLLEENEWKSFLETRAYEEKALEINDQTFWEVSNGFKIGTFHPLLLIYNNGKTRLINWKFIGMDELLYKKSALEDEAGSVI